MHRDRRQQSYGWPYSFLVRAKHTLRFCFIPLQNKQIQPIFKSLLFSISHFLSHIFPSLFSTLHPNFFVYYIKKRTQYIETSLSLSLLFSICIVDLRLCLFFSLLPNHVNSLTITKVGEPNRLKTDLVGLEDNMEIQRMKHLMLLWSTTQTTRVALVGGNHTAARFCTR